VLKKNNIEVKVFQHEAIRTKIIRYQYFDQEYPLMHWYEKNKQKAVISHRLLLASGP
jgi:hypothetical protein